MLRPVAGAAVYRDDEPGVAMTAELVPLARQTRQDLVREHVRLALELAFPLYTYKELKKLLRCEYHRFVVQLKERHTWDELTALTGMTRAGLNKLGDEVPPRDDRSVVRTILHLLQRAGDEGLRLSELAAGYYEACPDLDETLGFKEALQALLDDGAVVEADGRYCSRGHVRGWAPDLTRSMLESVRRIHRQVEAEQGAGAAEMTRFTFQVPSDPRAAEAVLSRMERALVAVAEEAEAEAGDDAQLMTVVLAAGRGML